MPIVVANEILDGTDGMCQCLGEREGLAHQTGHALPEESMEMLGETAKVR